MTPDMKISAVNQKYASEKAKFVHFKPWFTGSSNNVHTYYQILQITSFLMPMEPLKQFIKERK